jgi:hypothetical protein
MNRWARKGNVLHRIAALEARFTDDSGLAPHSPEWLVFWQRQIYLDTTEHVRLTLEGVRAVMQATPDKDGAVAQA